MAKKICGKVTNVNKTKNKRNEKKKITQKPRHKRIDRELTNDNNETYIKSS